MLYPNPIRRIKGIKNVAEGIKKGYNGFIPSLIIPLPKGLEIIKKFTPRDIKKELKMIEDIDIIILILSSTQFSR